MKRNRGIFGPHGVLSRRQFLTGTAAAGIGLSALPQFSRAAEAGQLNFYTWDTYIGETTLADFTRATGIAVKMDLFADNDELFAKLRSGNPGYDVIVPSNNWVARMALAGMLAPLNHRLIPNIQHIGARFMADASFDPGRKYSLPYMWGSIGMGYRKSKFTEPPDSLKFLYDSDQYSGRIALMSECDFLLGMALKYLGYSINATDAAQIVQAEALVIKQKPHIKSFAEDNGQDLLASGEVDLVMEWNGDIAQLMAEDDDIGYALPAEGAVLWEDTLAIPTGAPHPENAHAFINFIHDPKVNAAITKTVQYATPNQAALALMDDAYRRNPAIFPPEALIAKSEIITYRGEAVLTRRQEACTRIFAA
jgi:spermidine/putrescine transport system substrate-binding protein